MTHPPDPDRPEDDDLDAWIEEMSGRRPPSTAATQILRESIRQDSAAELDRLLGEAASDEAQQRARDRLRESLRRAREAQPMPDEPPLVRPPGGWASNQNRWRLVASLAVLTVIVSVAWQFRPQTEEDYRIADGGAVVWRDVTEPPRIVVADPAASAKALARQVAPFGGKPALYREGDTILVDFEVQPAQAAALAAAVADARIRAALRLGANRIIFAKS